VVCTLVRARRLRRTRWASKDLLKRALKQPRELRPKKTKNITTSALGETVGQIHMERQDYGELQTRKVKALSAKKGIPLAKKPFADAPSQGGDGDGEGGVESEDM
jgi:ribosome production factor 2